MMNHKKRLICPGCDSQFSQVACVSIVPIEYNTHTLAAPICKKCMTTLQQGGPAEEEIYEAISSRLLVKDGARRYGMETLSREDVYALKEFSGAMQTVKKQLGVEARRPLSSVPLDTSVSQADRSWFQARPERQCRLRKAAPCEWEAYPNHPVGQMPSFTLVRTYSTGRARLPVYTHGGGCASFGDDELSLLAVWELAVSQQPWGETELMLKRHVLAAQARILKNGDI